ncbi:MAG TPA: class I SAM-dependent methyltransferase [Actinomycetes bacterium]
MPFDHNDHYHRLLLRQLPPGCRTALDVGCGTGRFARRLAQRGLEVDAVDRSAEVLAAARGAPAPPAGRVRYLLADATRMRLPAGRYDVISCLASLHHLPFATVAALRQALAPGGVLVVLGCYRQRTATDYAVALAAAPLNLAARLAAAAERARGRAPGPPRPPIRPAAMPLGQVREEAARLLPGCTVRRLLFWRYLLVFRRPRDA